MPRLPRKCLNSSFIHIIVQGINQEFIFSDDCLKSIYKNLVKKNLGNFNIDVLAYCIMDNHAHFLIFFENYEELSKMMHSINTSYAMKYNKIKNRKGYVFRDRFFSQSILDTNHLFNCLVYIHFNPIAAHISHNLIDYNFSSYKEYLNHFELISSRAPSLLFGTNKKYIEQFHFLHNSYNMPNNIADINEEKIPPHHIIKQFELHFNKSLLEIESNRELFGLLLLELRKQSCLNLNEMSILLGISKYKLNQCIHEIIDKN